MSSWRVMNCPGSNRNSLPSGAANTKLFTSWVMSTTLRHTRSACSASSQHSGLHAGGSNSGSSAYASRSTCAPFSGGEAVSATVIFQNPSYCSRSAVRRGDAAATRLSAPQVFVEPGDVPGHEVVDLVLIRCVRSGHVGRAGDSDMSAVHQRAVLGVGVVPDIGE